MKKLILKDGTEIAILNMTRELFNANIKDKNEYTIRIELGENDFDADSVESVFTEDNLSSFQFVNDAGSLSYENYKLSHANESMNDAHTSILLTLDRK